MARLRDILRGWGPADPEIYSSETQVEAHRPRWKTIVLELHQ